jgi:hypothetical protein
MAIDVLQLTDRDRAAEGRLYVAEDLGAHHRAADRRPKEKTPRRLAGRGLTALPHGQCSDHRRPYSQLHRRRTAHGFMRISTRFCRWIVAAGLGFLFDGQAIASRAVEHIGCEAFIYPKSIAQALPRFGVATVGNPVPGGFTARHQAYLISVSPHGQVTDRHVVPLVSVVIDAPADQHSLPLGCRPTSALSVSSASSVCAGRGSVSLCAPSSLRTARRASSGN